MNREHYILRCRLDGGDTFLIWYSDEEDGVLVDADGLVPTFNDAGGLLKYARERGVSVDTESPALINLDALGRWLEEEGVGLIDPDSFNDAWNLLADVSRSIDGGFDADRELTRKIYDKLFWGCNLPGVTPEGKEYHPAWTRREIGIMRDVLGAGLRMFRSCLKSI